MAAVWLGCRVDDLDDAELLAVDGQCGSPELAVVVLLDELRVGDVEEAFVADPVEQEASAFEVGGPDEYL